MSSQDLPLENPSRLPLTSKNDKMEKDLYRNRHALIHLASRVRERFFSFLPSLVIPTLIDFRLCCSEMIKVRERVFKESA